ncbi:Mediator complex, subunit Med11 [Phaffia rhodozyma]|uniref:Mediator of RNA polymerase II transcription subunit 11 n=1 Tax=Phaffia rhodozyma TaxID=264483 RepID=A0A0F7SUW4_PHARH|nr:Mediator complex, subunit Med11 [Phaffia rhodozyma]
MVTKDASNLIPSAFISSTTLWSGTPEGQRFTGPAVKRASSLVTSVNYSPQIRSLFETDQKIAGLLDLISRSLLTLLPPNPDDPPMSNEDGSIMNEEERFVYLAKSFYQEIDDVQLVLRSTVHHLRLTHSLPLPSDFQPPPKGQLPATPFSSAPLLGLSDSSIPKSSKSKGLYELRMEADVLRQMRDSLKELKQLQDDPSSRMSTRDP